MRRQLNSKREIVNALRKGYVIELGYMYCNFDEWVEAWPSKVVVCHRLRDIPDRELMLNTIEFSEGFSSELVVQAVAIPRLQSERWDWTDETF